MSFSFLKGPVLPIMLHAPLLLFWLFSSAQGIMERDQRERAFEEMRDILDIDVAEIMVVLCILI